MEPKPSRSSDWRTMARSGNLAQRQPPPTRTYDQIDQIIRDNLNSEAEDLWMAVQRLLPSTSERAAWYAAPHEALGNETPAAVIQQGNYRRVLLALQPELLNPDCKM